MRFVFLTLGYHPDHIGGAYRYVTEVAERLAARGHEVEVIYPATTRHPAGSEARHGVQLHRFVSGPGNFFSNWRKKSALATALLAERMAASSAPTLIVLCHAYFSAAMRKVKGTWAYLFTGPWGAEYRFARQSAKASVLRAAMDGLIEHKMFAEELRALRAVGRILTISQYYVEQLPRWHDKQLPPTVMISGGVDTKRFCPATDRTAVRRQWGLNETDFLFLTVRRLDPRMGLKALIQTFGHVAKQFPHARLWLAGHGPQSDELQVQIDRLALGNCVRLLGFVPEEDLPRLYQSADCTVMPSLDLEGFGLSTVESLACGTPVIGSRAGATPELLAPLDESLLYPAGDTGALTTALQRVLNQPSTLPARDKCRSYAVEHFTWELPVASFEQCHKDLCRSGGGP